MPSFSHVDLKFNVKVFDLAIDLSLLFMSIGADLSSYNSYCNFFSVRDVLYSGVILQLPRHRKKMHDMSLLLLWILCCS